MWCKKGGGTGWGYCRIPYSYNGDEKCSFEMWATIVEAGEMMVFQSTNAIYDATKWISGFYITAVGDIKCYDGGVLTDTGFNLTQGAMDKWDVEHDFSAKTYDAWYDGDLIADDYDFKDGSATSLECIQIGCNKGVSAEAEIWIDNYQLGESGEIFAISPAKHGAMAGGVPT